MVVHLVDQEEGRVEGELEIRNMDWDEYEACLVMVMAFLLECGGEVPGIGAFALGEDWADEAVVVVELHRVGRKD